MRVGISQSLVGVPFDFVGLVDEHVDERRLAMMEVTDDGDVANRFGMRCEIEEEAVLVSERVIRGALKEVMMRTWCRSGSRVLLHPSPSPETCVFSAAR